VISQDVTRRTSEIGIRMALGAHRIDVIRLVMRQMLIVVVLGAVSGVALSYAATQLIKGMLFEIAANDLVTMVAGGAWLMIVASFAAYLPARRASRFEPTQALRYE
jgi:ABC-type antimicrobial peptide transport system permease subunit